MGWNQLLGKRFNYTFVIYSRRLGNHTVTVTWQMPYVDDLGRASLAN